jgi:D-psicose/D-tagatose/L-ribulose 3-epimerase
MRYGMNLLLWTGMVGEEHFPLFDKLQQWGFDGVELPLIDSDEAVLPKIKTCLDDLGLASTTATICTPHENPIHEDPAIRRAALDRIKRRIDWTATLGSELLMGPYHSAIGVFTGRGRTDSEWSWCVEYLRAAAEHAAQAGVKMSVEPLNRFECYFLNTMADSDRLVAEVAHPALGYVYDTFHANIEEKDIRASVLNNARGINHFHISENDRGVPGTGHVRWSETFQALKSTGYDGWLTIESFGRALPELAAATCIWRDLFSSAEDVAVQGLAFAKAQWESA